MSLHPKFLYWKKLQKKLLVMKNSEHHLEKKCELLSGRAQVKVLGSSLNARQELCLSAGLASKLASLV